MKNEIVVIKFPSGEEVIGKLIDETETDYVFENALGVTIVPDPANPRSAKAELYDLSHFADDKNSTFNKATVMMRPRKVKDALEKMYFSKVSGIVIAQPSALLKG